MPKEYKIQKKKTPLNKLLQIIFKALVTVAVIIFIILIYNKFGSSSLDFSGASKNKTSSNIPSKLNWFNDFKGVENIPSKVQKENNKEKSGNFLGFGSSK